METEMNLSISLPFFFAEEPPNWDIFFERARLADLAGIDRLYVADHVVFGEHMDEYARPEVGGRKEGRQPTGPDGHWLEPLTALSALVGITSRVRLCTAILIAPLRRPVVLAKTATTIDVLSKGRLDLGVGLGWQREEYEAAGLRFEDRGRLLDECLEVCQVLWRDPVAEFASPNLSFSGIHMMPKPVQLGGVPIWTSGTANRRVARRLARFGQRWIPWGDAADDPAAGIKEMHSLLAEAGAPAADLQVMGFLPMRRGGQVGLDIDGMIAPLAVFKKAGVTDMQLHVPLSEDSATCAEQLTALVAAFRDAVGRPPASQDWLTSGAVTTFRHGAN
jgi:probable F420-dependent oxidoreductase